MKRAHVQARVVLLELHRHADGISALLDWRIGRQRGTVIAVAAAGSTGAIELGTVESGDLLDVTGEATQLTEPTHMLGEIVRLDLSRARLVRREPNLWRRVSKNEPRPE